MCLIWLGETVANGRASECTPRGNGACGGLVGDIAGGTLLPSLESASPGEVSWRMVTFVPVFSNATNESL